MNIYTYEERTVHKYQVRDAVKIAEEILKSRGKSTRIVLREGYRNLNAHITMEDVNEIKDIILMDHSYFESNWTTKRPYEMRGSNDYY